jgi:predicted NAD/FAD-dependent oxidoreductase
MMDVFIVGAGIGGLTLALELHRREIPCRIFESAPPSVLLDALKERLGERNLHLGWHCLGFEQTESRVTLRFKARYTSAPAIGRSRASTK